MIFFRLPLQKPSPEHGETGEGFQNGEDIKNLNLHAVRYSYYMQHMTAITYSSLLRAMRLLPLRLTTRSE